MKNTKKRRTQISVLLILLCLLAGCRQNPHNAQKTNDYVPPVNEDGYIVVNFPATVLGGSTAEETAEGFRDDEFFENAGLTPMTERVTDVIANEDGSVNYIFTPEQYEPFKKDTYKVPLYQYTGGFPDSIKSGQYTDIDAEGIPWGVEVLVDKAAYEEDAFVSSIFATVWPATYLGQYQILCGVDGDEWTAHITVKDADTGEVISESDFPTRDE